MKFKTMNNTTIVNVTANKSDDTTVITTILKKVKRRKTLGEYIPGDVIKLGEREYIVLEQLGDRTAIITKDFVKKMEFGGTSDYFNSDVRAYLNSEFYQELVETVGLGNIAKHPVSLTAEDGTGVGFCRDCVSILTTERYRAYRKFLPAYESWWYTATRVSADVERYARSVCFVSADGVLSWCGCDGGSGGVRPFVVLNSAILV